MIRPDLVRVIERVAICGGVNAFTRMLLLRGESQEISTTIRLRTCQAVDMALDQ